MKIYWIILLTTLVIQNTAIGQAEAKKLKQAEESFSTDQFSIALPIYLDLLNSDPENNYLNFRAGLCYLSSRSQKAKAVDYLERVVSTNYDQNKKITIMAYKLLGDAYNHTYQFEDAIVAYENFKNLYPANEKDSALINEVNWKIEMCKVGKQLKGLVSSPKISTDQSTMSFTFQKPGSKNEKEELFFENTEPTTVTDPKSIFVKDTTNVVKNEANIATSVDGQVVLTYTDDYGNSTLRVTTLVGNNWTEPEKLTIPINDKGWENNEYMTADGSAIYFTSDRPGGFGGKDIYKCKKLTDGEWSKAINLGSGINTSFDEEAPFIYPDGVTLFFSSDRDTAKGGFQIYTTTLTAENWSKPIDIGYPAKITADEISYTATINNSHPAETKSSIPFNSKEKTTNKEKSINDINNCTITFLNLKESPFTLMKGEITDINRKTPQQVNIKVIDNETGEILSSYHPDKTGKFAFILPPKRNNNIVYEADGYLFHSENMNITKEMNYYEVNRIIELAPVNINSKIVLNNIFFQTDNTIIEAISNTELNRVYKLLSENLKLKVEISGYIETKQNVKYNTKIAEMRAEAIVNFLAEKGIKKERMTTKGYTKSRSGLPNSRSNEWMELKITGVELITNKKTKTKKHDIN